MWFWKKKDKEVAFKNPLEDREGPNVYWLAQSNMPAQNVLHGAYKENLEGVSLVGRTKDGKLYMATSHAKRESTVYDLIRMIVETVTAP